jgi:hypothetical protein
LSGGAIVFLFFLLPETYEPTILLRRAERLRKVTGNSRYRTACEVSMIASVSFFDRFLVNLKRAIVLSFDPAIFVANMCVFFFFLFFSVRLVSFFAGSYFPPNSHLGLVYSILYLFFESFPIVFIDKHGFVSLFLFSFARLFSSLRTSLLQPLTSSFMRRTSARTDSLSSASSSRRLSPFVPPSLLSRLVLTPLFSQFLAYYLYQTNYINPRIAGKGRPFTPETRLEIGIAAGGFIVASLLIFGWCGEK